MHSVSGRAETGCVCVRACVRACVRVCVCVCGYCLIGDTGRLRYLIKVLFVEMYVNVFFVIRCSYIAVG